MGSSTAFFGLSGQHLPAMTRSMFFSFHLLFQGGLAFLGPNPLCIPVFPHGTGDFSVSLLLICRYLGAWTFQMAAGREFSTVDEAIRIALVWTIQLFWVKN